MLSVTKEMFGDRVKEKGLFTSVTSTMCSFCALDYNDDEENLKPAAKVLKPAAKPPLRRSAREVPGANKKPRGKKPKPEAVKLLSVTEEMLGDRAKEKGLFTSVTSTMFFLCSRLR